jgi:hypothetical protein
MTSRMSFLFLITLLVSAVWPGPSHGQKSRTMLMKRVVANPAAVAETTSEILAGLGFALDSDRKPGTVGKANLPHASTPCEHLQTAAGEWVLQVDLNPRGFGIARDTTLLVLSFEETKPVLAARRAEGVAVMEDDCLTRYTRRLADSIKVRAESSP